MKKRIVACFVAVALCFGLMPVAPAFAQVGAGNAGQIADAGGSNPAEEGAWHATTPGAADVRVSKTIEPTGIENYFDITLTAQTKRTTTDQSISAVIVLDVSNTMNQPAGSSTRIANAKAAANQFINQFCSHGNLDSDRQIGIVAFNTNASWAVPLTEANSAAAADALRDEVNDIAASPDPAADVNHVRFTNMEGGLELARQALAADDAVNKYVILLTDGFPTTYVESYDAATSSIRGYDPYTPQATSSVPGEFYDEVAGAPCSYGTSYSDRAAIRARRTADSMKAEGVNVFCVGIAVGDQTIEYYRELSDRMAQGTDPSSVMDCTGPSYEIESNGANAYRDWLGNDVAGGPALGQAGHVRYGDGDNLAELESAYESFLHEIELSQVKPFATLLTSDPMGQNIEFLHFLARDGEPADTLDGAPEEGAENTASFNSDTQSISWNHLQSGFTAVQDGEDIEILTYSLTYRVRVANETSGFAFDEALPTNADAVLKFTAENSVESGELAYPDPSVEAYEGALSFAKLTDAATPDDESDDGGLAGAEFVLTHSSACPECAAARKAGSIDENVNILPLLAISGEDGAVRFRGIPSGHEYVLSESTAPEGHESDSRTSVVTVAYGETTVVPSDNALLNWEDGAYLVRNAQIPLEPGSPEEPVDSDVPAGETPGSADSSASYYPASFASTNDHVSLIVVGLLAVIAVGLAATAFDLRRRR